MVKRLGLLAVFMGCLGVILWFVQLSESKQRYVRHLARQIPYLPARYFV